MMNFEVNKPLSFNAFLINIEFQIPVPVKLKSNINNTAKLHYSMFLVHYSIFTLTVTRLKLSEQARNYSCLPFLLVS